MTGNFVDFKTIKQRVSMEMVLDHYNVKLHRVNQFSLRGKCPLPAHTSESSKNSFSVQTQKNIWACQSTSCAATRQGKKGGNMLDFVAMMESCSIREAALKLHDWFVPATPAQRASATKKDRGKPTGKLVAEKKEGSEQTNKPLSFTLKDIDCSHPYLRHRGITEETAREFGVGFFPGRGSMSQRVVIPISNERGELVAYGGRSIDETEPKYKLPASFVKSAVLFNLHRVLESSAHCSTGKDVVIVVEGFFDCMKVHQAGVPSVVALMGSSMSEAQQELLCRFKRIILFLDGDEPGRVAAQSIGARLMYQMLVQIVNLPDGKQPDQLSSEKIRAVLQV